MLVVATTVVAEEKAPKNPLSINTLVKYNGDWYKLKWSSHPQPNYYKHEYLQKGETPGKYTEMIMIDVLEGNIGSKQALQVKVSELDAKKKANPIVNYNIYKNEKTNELVLDFVLTDGGDLYEWNLYRYIDAEKGSKKCLVLIAYTYRNIITDRESMLQFFGYIKDSRAEMMDKLYDMDFPRFRFK